MAESDNPRNSMILAMVVATVASLVALVLVIVQFFDMSVRTEVQEKVLSQQSSLLRDLRASEQNKLSKYVWIDQKAGIVQVPVERAAELTLRDWDKRPSGLVKVDDNAAPPPAAAPAPVPAAPAPAAPGAAAPAAGGAAPAPAAPAAVPPVPAAPAPAAGSQPPKPEAPKEPVK